MSDARGFIKFSRCDKCECCYGAHSPECPRQIDVIVEKVTSSFRRELQNIAATKPMLCLITGSPVEPWALRAMESAKFKRVSECVPVYHNMCGNRTIYKQCECRDCREMSAIKGDKS